jgi:hypothetical protein
VNIILDVSSKFYATGRPSLDLLISGIDNFHPDTEFCAGYKYKRSTKLTYTVTVTDNT